MRDSGTNPHGIIIPHLVVADRIAQCKARNTKTNYPDSIHHIVIHRISLAKYEKPWNYAPIMDGYLDALALAFRFGNPLSPTGGAIPYHLLIRKDGTCEQMLPLYTRGAHAIKANPYSIGLAVAVSEGDALTDAQKVALPFVLAGLIPLNQLLCVSHDQVPGGSADASKICPGFSWAEYDMAARAMLPDGWRAWTHEQCEAWVIGKGFVLQKPMTVG